MHSGQGLLLTRAVGPQWGQTVVDVYRISGVPLCQPHGGSQVLFPDTLVYLEMALLRTRARWEQEYISLSSYWYPTNPIPTPTLPLSLLFRILAIRGLAIVSVPGHSSTSRSVGKGTSPSNSSLISLHHYLASHHCLAPFPCLASFSCIASPHCLISLPCLLPLSCIIACLIALPCCITLVPCIIVSLTSPIK